MFEQQKLRRLCAFAQMRSLARAFAIRIQNISTFRRRWRATNVGLYCLCEQQKLKESAQSRCIQNIKKTQTQSRRRFFLQKLMRLRICAGWADSLSYSVHLIDLDTQSTLVFIAYARSRSSDEYVQSGQGLFYLCMKNKYIREASRPNMYSKYGPWREKTWFCSMRTTKAQTSLRIWSASLIFALWKL